MGGRLKHGGWSQKESHCQLRAPICGRCALELRLLFPRSQATHRFNLSSRSVGVGCSNPLCSHLVVLESAEPRVGEDQSVEHLVDHVRHAVDQVLRLRTASGCRGCVGCVVIVIGGGRAGDERAARVEADCGGGGRAGYGARDGERVTTAHVPEEQARSERTVHREEWQRERYCTSGVGEGIGPQGILGAKGDTPR